MAVVALAVAAPALAQWPTTCVGLNDIVEAHLGNDGNVGIYQRVFGEQAKPRCQNDHLDDVRAVFAWAFDHAAESTHGQEPDLAWPTDCVELNDIVEAHLDNDHNVRIYQRTFGDQAELGCRNDHRDDVRGVFAWAFDDVRVGSSASAAPTATPAVPAWSFVDSGYFHSCGVRGEGAVSCWGTYFDPSGGLYIGQATAPSGTFLSATAGNFHSCGRRADWSVACWGSNDFGHVNPPSGGFLSVSAGGLHSCGVRSDQTVACWGLDNNRQSTAPAGTFASVSAGDAHTCGVRTDAPVACWGWNESGQATPPTGTFRSVSAGNNYTCGVRATDATVVCWGSNRYGQGTPPAGAFDSVSAGTAFTCGVRPNGVAVCWGWNGHGQAAPPGGVFRSLSAGWNHACGLRTFGSAVCWGSNDHGQARPPAQDRYG